VRVTHEGSMEEYERLLQNPPPGPKTSLKPSRTDPYAIGGKSVLALVRSDSRGEGIKEALRLMGGVKPLCDGVEGEIVIKPNCNTDDPFPRNTHPETVRIIAESLMEAGFPSGRIVVGDMSGRYRGLPTRSTMENLGLRKVADDLGIQLSYFEEEEWVTVKHPRNRAWPRGMKIPKRIYDADRVILTPIMRPHDNATFTIALKLAVGLIDAVGREWLHNGEAFYEKMVELNLAFSADLVVTDALKCLIASGRMQRETAESGVIIAGSNRVAADAVAAAVMKHYGAHGVIDKPVQGQRQIVLAEQLGLGTPKLDEMVLRTSNLAEDEAFDAVIQTVRDELS